MRTTYYMEVGRSAGIKGSRSSLRGGAYSAIGLILCSKG